MKICIITDERTGGTCFTSAFSTCGLIVGHDPQTRSAEKFNREFNNTTDLLSFSYQKFDVVKLCYTGFSIKQYTEILDYCIRNNIIIIILHREDIFKRAQSKCVADKLKIYHALSLNKVYKPFSINLDLYKRIIHHYNSHITSHINYLNNNNYNYYFVTYEELFSNKTLIYDLFQHLGLIIQDQSKLNKLMSIDYNTITKNSLLQNFDKIREINNDYSKPSFLLTCSIKY